VSDYCEGGGEASTDAMGSSTRGADDSEAREREITVKEEGRHICSDFPIELAGLRHGKFWPIRRRMHKG